MSLEVDSSPLLHVLGHMSSGGCEIKDATARDKMDEYPTCLSSQQGVSTVKHFIADPTHFVEVEDIAFSKVKESIQAN